MSTLLKACISRSALRHNVRILRDRAKGVPLCAMIKANAYGHGAKIVAQALSDMDIAFWGVAVMEEALDLPALEKPRPILVVQPVGKYEPDSETHDRIDLMIDREIRATVADEQGLDLLAARASRRNKKIYVHVKVDTGMGRNGCSPGDALKLVLKACTTPCVTIEGLYSHFACADEADLRFARAQLAAFQTVINELSAKGIKIPIVHMANSAALFNLPESWMDMVRPGLALYGYGGSNIAGSCMLKPALRLVAPVLMIKRIEKGRSSGYGATFNAARETRAGLLPVGYADGYSRRLSNLGSMEVNGRQFPVIGRVSMDFTMIDLTDMPEAGVGTEVCVISNRREAPNSVESMAKQLDTIPHEVTSTLGNRVQRILVE